MSQRSPQVVVSANTPLLAALVFHLAMKARRIPVIFWMQDVYSQAMAAHLRRRGGAVASALAWMMGRVERWIARSSARVVVISEAFVETLEDWGVPLARIDVVENWAPLEEVPNGARPNAWSERHGIEVDHVVLLYAGTLGLKHRPELLLALADAFADDPNVRVVVASEGVGARWLRSKSSSSLEQIPFQPYDELPDMLASADVLLVLLEPDAGEYSVPSKVLTYHCAGRPILGAMPSSNLASSIILTNDSGVVVDPSDTDAFVASARCLIGDADGRRRQGANARAYAERTFDVEAITNRFVGFIDGVLAGRR